MPSLSGEQGQIWMMSIQTKQGPKIELRGYCVECSLKLESAGSNKNQTSPKYLEREIIIFFII